MSNVVEFLLKLTDQFSPAMKAAASITESAGGKIKSQFTGLEYTGKMFTSSLKDMKSQLNQLNDIKAGTHIKREFEAANIAAGKLERQIEKIEGKSKSVGNSGFSLGGLVKGNLIASAISSGAGLIKDFTSDIYQTSLKNASLKTAINSTTGGQGAAAVAQTHAISNKYGLNYEASLEGVKTLTGGLKSMNMPLVEQMKIFEGVSTGIAAMKLSSDESKGAMLALGQMASKGIVSAEELRGQLGERIPGAFGIAAKAMGVTESKLNDLLQKGLIPSKEFLPKFAAEMQKTFGADALAAANGPAAIQERFNNAMFKMKDIIGNGLMPIITPMIEKFTTLAMTVIPYIQTGIEYVVGLFTGVNAGTGQWAAYFSIIKNHASAVWETVKSLWNNISHIVSGVAAWAVKSQLVQDIFWAIGKSAEFVWWTVSKIGDGLSWLWDNVIKPILDKIEWVYSHMKGLFNGGKSEIVVTDGTHKVLAEGVQKSLGTSGAMQLTLPPDTIIAAKNTGIPKAPGANKMTPLGISRDKVGAVNNGGQRSLIINIAKLGGIEKMEVHNIKESTVELQSIIQEALKRALYNINSMEPA